ncbi:hypothetical protein PV326_009041 [Microctonus aethiopoides]|nr:hypothetical protein PV326_009041 [Microctonus aethiopoides]
MNDKRAGSSELKIMKKSDKMPSVSYRDYLDMDTDEEEFGRQETPEPDEELSLEPDKPIFTNRELNTLVDYVKNLTLVPDADEFILSEKHADIIREYFRNPSYTILTIFYDGMEYRAHLDFPSCVNRGLTYFLRSSWQIYTVDNFMSTVLYGSLNSNVENSILKFMENIYAPIAISHKDWPKVTRDEVFSNLNEFLISLTDATYEPMGLTILYVPREGMQSYQNNSENNGIIERLERVARYWIKQIRGVLCGVNVPPKSAYMTIIDELQFWNRRFENLSCLKSQLSSETIITIVHILEKIKSSSVTDFHRLVTEMNALLIEASSNITYLNLLADHCCDFEIPHGINDYAVKILLLIRFIGIESEFYNSVDKIKALCQALGTQIVIQCKKNIDLELVLENDPEIGKNMLENCSNCCEKFLEIFYQLTIMDRTSDIMTFSKIDEKTAFCHVNTFIQRCQDLIEVADTRIVFDKSKEVKKIGGARALEHELQYKKIQESFYETLNKIKQNRDCILDVTIFTWLQQISHFRSQVDNIDNMMNNLIHNIFDDILNVEEGLEALYSMKSIDNKANTNSELKYFSIDTATLLHVKSNYLTRQYNMLIDASDWFDDNTPIFIIEKYKRIQAFLTQKKNNL